MTNARLMRNSSKPENHPISSGALTSAPVNTTQKLTSFSVLNDPYKKARLFK